MVKITLALFTIILFTACVPQSNDQQNDIVSESNPIVDSVQLWLSEGTHMADVMNAYNSPRITELSEKMARGMKENQEWYLDYIKEAPEGEKMPYHENIGLTKEEYEELLIGYEDIQVFSSATEKLNIICEPDSIKFESNGPTIVGLNFCVYNKTSNTFSFSAPGKPSFILEYKKEINIENASNAFQSKWHGYKWTYEYGTEGFDIDNISTLSEIPDMVRFEITLGRMEVDQRVFLNMKIDVSSNGQVSNNELPLLIK